MGIRTHDLLRLRESTELKSNRVIPEWVYESLESVPFVVVRRASITNDWIPVGVRGEQRNQRFGAYIKENDIVQCIRPCQLVDQEKWNQNIRRNRMPAFRVLDDVNEILDSYGAIWGPAGSVGFELASGSSTVTESSDLDLVIYCSNIMPLEKAKKIATEFNQMPIRVDVQIETPNGAISLTEYVRDEHPLLLKTKEGPRLVHEPWGECSVDV